MTWYTRKTLATDSLRCLAARTPFDVVVEHHEPGHWTASVVGGEVKDSPSDWFLRSAVGFGFTEAAALSDLASMLSGKTLVFRAMRNDRREIQMPIITSVE